MRLLLAGLLVAAVLGIAGCGDDEPAVTTGISGRVLLGPQCPVEVAGEPCDDEPTAHVTVTVSRRAAAGSAPVATTSTDADGRFRVSVAPGDYVVTAEAGMSCDDVAVRVPDGGYARIAVACDTGIR
jgi:hypothetical protein